MKKIKLLLSVLVLSLCVNAQFETDTVNVKNPQNNLKETIVGYSITIKFDDLNLDSLAKGVLVYNDSTSYVKDAYKIYTRGIGDTTFIMQGADTYTTTNYEILKTWQPFINGSVVPAKAISDKVNYYLKGYKTERKPYE